MSSGIAFVDETPEKSVPFSAPEQNSSSPQQNFSSPQGESSPSAAATATETTETHSTSVPSWLPSFMHTRGGASSSQNSQEMATGSDADHDHVQAPPDNFFGKISYFIGRLKVVKDENTRNLRPWREFFDRTQFSMPGKMEAFSRANKNLSYFYSNYVVMSVCVSAWVLFTNIGFMIMVLCCAAWFFYVRHKAANNQSINLRGREVSPTQAYTALFIFGLVMFYYTGGSSTIFWLLTSTALIVLGHAAARHPVAEANQFSFV